MRPELLARLRSLVSYLPSSSLLWARSLVDVPDRLRRRPHESDFVALRGIGAVRPTVLDIGANRGQSIRSLRLVLDHPRIHSFEPNPILARHLRRAHRRDPDVTVHEVALADEAGTLDLFIPRYGNTYYDTRASLAPDEPTAFLGPESFHPYRPGRASVDRVSVAIGCVDDLGLRPDIVKIDVEGLDDRVVAGAVRTLAACRPVVLVERPRPGTIATMSSLGYLELAFDPDGGVLRPGPGPLNTFFLPQERPTSLG